MKKDRYSNEEKRLCTQQEALTKTHVKNCSICKQSMKEFEQFGISNTPPCKRYQDQLTSHVNNCIECNKAKNNYNEDSIPITTEMREIVSELKQGRIFNIDPMKLKRVASDLFGKLNMSSDEIKDMQDKANKAVKDGLDNAVDR